MTPCFSVRYTEESNAFEGPSRSVPVTLEQDQGLDDWVNNPSKSALIATLMLCASSYAASRHSLQEALHHCLVTKNIRLVAERKAWPGCICVAADRCACVLTVRYTILETPPWWECLLLGAQVQPLGDWPGHVSFLHSRCESSWDRAPELGLFHQ